MISSDVDKTKACAVKLYGTTSYGIMCVDPVRAVGTEKLKNNISVAHRFFNMIFSLCFFFIFFD